MNKIIKTIQYNPKCKFGKTGITVNKGDLMSVDVKILEPWIDFYCPSNLDGFNFFLKSLFPPRWKDEKYYCLCACVGKEEDYFIKIGEGINNFKLEKAGELYIFVNDYNAEWAYKNN